MKLNYPRSKTLFLIIVTCLSFFNGFSQNRDLQLAEDYLRTKEEVTFSFVIDDVSELRQLTSQMSILNFDPSTNRVYAWANTNQFRKFQRLGIEFTIDRTENEAHGIVMSNELPASSQRGPYPLTFPLTAYPTYADYALQMQEFANNHPNICELVDIGGTTEGVAGGDKRLLFIKLSDNVGTEEAEPKVMYTSSMHGDEITGYPLMMNLINYFITAYEDTGHSDHLRIKNLIDNSEVWINPMANPDGTYYNNASNTSVANARRANANGVDLNRNYPDNVAGPHDDGNAYQVETQHFMTLADNNHFVLSANFHGGTEVVNYPFDNTYTDHADSDWFFHVSKEYAVNCQDNSPNGYMDAEYANHQWDGVTEGADWYQVFGGRQDFMNFYHQCKEVTIELSNTKLIPANQLVNHWNYNQEALIEYLIQGTYGFQGLVKDAISGDPVEATVTLVGHDAVGSHTVSSPLFGDFYRPVKAGTYDILFEAPCYQSFTLNSQTIADYETKILADIMLTPLTASSPTNLGTSGTDSSSTNASWTATTADSFDIRYREVGSPTWTEILDVTSNPYQITGLNPNTTYEFQVKSYCGTNSTAYSTSEQFTTTNINYCTAQGNSIADEYIGNVNINGLDNNTTASTSSGYSDHTASVIFADLETNSNTNTISVTKHWTGTIYSEAISAWIDFNQNGTFESGEKIFESPSSNTATVTGNFSVPVNAALGNTRMRVILKYYNGNGQTADDACETFTYGEVEDYTVNIISETLGVTTFNDQYLTVYPNPYQNAINIRLKNNYALDIDIIEASGRSIIKMNNIIAKDNIININNLQNLSTGIYFIKLTDTKTNTSVIKRIIKR
ncbi:M14 family zinc carboxypeptidase [Hanstruepera flava]|uniref:M14 family zinc carboxypeptidase n=1 Tax=Hanstruepera flava TaxID=2930218 RepID=UPI00202834D7|nr:M14 family zinc carboxypeptidase [Hanstruepera flava]